MNAKYTCNIHLDVIERIFIITNLGYVLFFFYSVVACAQEYNSFFHQNLSKNFIMYVIVIITT